jgi:hypothetical protein
VNKKLSLFLASISILLPGCSSLPSFNFDQPAFQPYVDDFVLSAKDNGVLVNESHITVRFADLRLFESDVLAWCDYFERTVYVDKNKWKLSSRARKQLSVTHELGHCVLGLPHKDLASANNIMSTEQMAPDEYLRNKARYDAELFADRESYNKLGDQYRSIKNIDEQLTYYRQLIR